MGILSLLATLTALPAHADLYRWVDPQTGSVKFSSYPPPWFGDQAREPNAPATEVIVYQAPGAPKPSAVPAKPSAAAHQALSAEPDRLDPAGAARRRALEAQVGKK